MTYRAKYRCRMCCKVFETGGSTSNGLLAQEMIWRFSQSLENSSDALAPIEFIDHACASGNIGLADFIGWETSDDQN